MREVAWNWGKIVPIKSLKSRKFGGQRGENQEGRCSKIIRLEDKGGIWNIKELNANQFKEKLELHHEPRIFAEGYYIQMILEGLHDKEEGGEGIKKKPLVKHKMCYTKQRLVWSGHQHA